MVTKKYILKICDFGLAEALIKTKQMIVKGAGTPLYLSPEVCQNQPYSFKSDIWSMGIILYEMVTRRFPFYGYTERVLFYNII